MTRSKSRSPISKVTPLRRSRRLRFDVLEDRRLLAGIDVFVFDDLDGSSVFNPAREGSVAERTVYIDLDNDGRLGGSEPWAVSDHTGHAHFSDIGPGNYSVRLVGSNKSIVQTFPTRPADQGNWSDAAVVTKALQMEGDGSVWTISGNALTRIDVVQNRILSSISFGAASIVDAALVSSASGELTGYALTRNPDQSQALWNVSTSGEGSKQLTSVNVETTSQLVSVGSKILAVSRGSGTIVSLVDSETPSSAVVLKDLGITSLSSNATVTSSGVSSFLVAETGAGTNRLSLYGLNGDRGQLLGERSFASRLLSASVSRGGDFIAASTADDFWILSPRIGLPTLAILPEAVGPIGFDPLRGLLFTGTNSSPSNLSSWNTSTWTQSQSIFIANGGTLSEAKLLLDGTGSQLVVSQNNAIYTQSLAVATAAVATVSGNRITQLQIGLRSIGANRVPELNDLDPIAVDEDGNLNIDADRIRSNSSDLDGDSLVYLVRTNPSYGLLNLNQDATGVYTPFANANGRDSIAIQAYDGRDWSTSRILPIVINPVNDVPSGISFSVDSVSENPSLGTALAGIRTLDPDTDADYRYEVDDPRFSVADGFLRLVQGTINFENEPIIVLAVTGFDRQHPSDIISRQITLSVRDVNEAPSGVSTPNSLTQPELTNDLVLGRVFAIDQDENEQYSWSVSDPRFEIVNGILRLTEGSVLDFESEPYLQLVLRGTDSHGEFSIEETVTVSVTDQDDEPTGISFVGAFSIQENDPGRAIGNARVLDPDRGEAYSISVNDSRFEVVRGVLQLRPGAEIDYTESGYLDLMLTATSLQSGIRISESLRFDVVPDPTPHHNDVNPYDVDGDGVLTPLDPLVVINHINDNGIGPIEEPEGEGPLPDLDVDGDGEVTPLDILILINKLNQRIEDDEESGSGESDGEGESAKFVAAKVPMSQPSLLDASLASYLSDLSDEIGPRKTRRR